MPPLSTRVDSPLSPQPIHYVDGIVSLGSCFSEHIGSHLSHLGYAANINPFGILYNPLSIAKAIERLEDPKQFVEHDLIAHNGLYHSVMHHGSFSRETAEETTREINERLNRAAEAYAKSRVLMLTWGTAYVFFEKGTQQVVANCHKLPAWHFDRRMLSFEELAVPITPLLLRYLEEDQKRRIILTVSPIRHLSDGAHENTRSKAQLHLLTEKIRALAPERISYFPAYEILLDELRDYRFYADDMSHPSQLAIKIIRERFVDSHLAPEESVQRKEVWAWRRLSEHRPISRSDKATNAQLEKIETIKLSLMHRYPSLHI